MTAPAFPRMWDQVTVGEPGSGRCRFTNLADETPTVTVDVVDVPREGSETQKPGEAEQGEPA